MKSITEIDEANKQLELYSDAIFHVVAYSDSLKKITIKLSFDGNEEIVYLIAVGCKSMSGDFSYSGADLKIHSYFDKETTTVITVIKSESFKLTANGGFALIVGSDSEVSRFSNHITPNAPLI